MRTAIDVAAGGQTQATEDVGAVLMRVLGQAEQDHLFSLLAVKHSDLADVGKQAMWATLGRSVVHVALQQAQSSAMFLALLCMVLGHAILGSRRRIRETLDIHILFSIWRRAQGQHEVHLTAPPYQLQAMWDEQSIEIV